MKRIQHGNITSSPFFNDKTFVTTSKLPSSAAIWRMETTGVPNFKTKRGAYNEKQYHAIHLNAFIPYNLL